MRININNTIDLIISYLIELRNIDNLNSKDFNNELLKFIIYLEKVLNNNEDEVLFDKNFITNKKNFNRINKAIKPKKEDIVALKNLVVNFSQTSKEKEYVDDMKEKLRLIASSLIKTKYESNKLEV